jgi:hypothetical protein
MSRPPDGASPVHSKINQEIRHLNRLPVFVLLAAFAASCGDNDFDNAPSDPGTSPPPTISETFPPEPGTLTPNGGVTHPFVVQRVGEVTATLTTLTPEGTVVGLGLGTWNGSVCSFAQGIARDAATQGQTLVGNATATANYCVRVYDAAGSLTGPVQYQVTVTHF